MLLPLMETLHEMGGEAPAGKVIEALSDRFAVPEGVRNAYEPKDYGRWGVRRRCSWRQTVHWVRQDAVARGYIRKNGYGVWTLTDAGTNTLKNSVPGVILIVFETPSGQAIWTEAMTAAGALQDNSVNLLFTSPPYPVLCGRRYGTFTEAEVIELLVGCAKDWRRGLTEDGSLILNLKDVWLPKSKTGGAVRSLYQEKLLLALCEDAGYYFADRLYWRNPSHTPESCWVTVKKVRCNQDVEQLFWLSRSPNPFADARNVMVDAKPSTIQTYQRRAARGVGAAKTGPSGQKNHFEEQMEKVRNSGALRVIPRNLLEIANSDTHTVLREALSAAGLPRHDAMMPEKLPEFFIRFLTRLADVVYDPFFGSGTTGLAAERLGRRWLGSDRSLAHLMGAGLRFTNAAFE